MNKRSKRGLDSNPEEGKRSNIMKKTFILGFPKYERKAETTEISNWSQLKERINPNYIKYFFTES